MQKIAKLILDSEIFKIDFKNGFQFSSGKIYPFYCDNRLLLSMPRERGIIIATMINKIKEENIQCSIISGIETSSIPWAGMLAFKLAKPLIYVRKEAKKHGTQKKIEGRFNSNDRVLLIEDLISTGNSAINAIKALKEANLEIDYCMAIFTYNIGNPTRIFNELGVKLLTLTNINELVQEAVKKKIINEKQMAEILNFQKWPTL